MTASICDSAFTHSTSPVLLSTCVISCLSLVPTAALANSAVMPWPISAGVFGMARTTRSLPSQAAIVSLRMPAATLRCRAWGAWARVCAAASLKVWGFTAHTTRSARFKKSPASGWAVMPNCACSLLRASSIGSTTSIWEEAVPWPIRPPMMALAILPPPMNAMRCCMRVFSGVGL